MASSRNITELLVAWGDSDQAALDELMPLVYDELRGLASAYLASGRQGHTLQTTALVHEAQPQAGRPAMGGVAEPGPFLRGPPNFAADPGSHPRAHQAKKRGHGAPPLSLDEAPEVSAKPKVDLVAFDEALDRLAEIDPRPGLVVELRFFGGLSIEEASEVLSLAPATVGREWRVAQAWLHKELGGSPA